MTLPSTTTRVVSISSVPVRVDDRLRFKARIQRRLARLARLGLCRLPNSLARLDWLAEQRVIVGVDAVAADRVVRVRAARLDLAIGGEPAHVDGPFLGRRLRLGLGASFGEARRTRRNRPRHRPHRKPPTCRTTHPGTQRRGRPSPDRHHITPPPHAKPHQEDARHADAPRKLRARAWSLPRSGTASPCH